MDILRRVQLVSVASLCFALTGVALGAGYMLYRHGGPLLEGRDRPEPTSEQREPARWHWDFYSLIGHQFGDRPSFPLVHLRSGYKYLRRNGEKGRVGFRYDLVNVGPRRLEVKVDYCIHDVDGFEVTTRSASSVVDPKSYSTILGTTDVHPEDVGRLGRASWAISYSVTEGIEAETPDSETVALSPRDRYAAAGSILKEDTPVWVTNFAEYYVDYGFGCAVEDSKWSVIATILEIEKNLLVGHSWIFSKLDASVHDLPPLAELVQHPEYERLDVFEQLTVRRWLKRFEAFGHYDPEIGMLEEPVLTLLAVQD